MYHSVGGCLWGRGVRLWRDGSLPGGEGSSWREGLHGGGRPPPPPYRHWDRVNRRSVRILLECILVTVMECVWYLFALAGSWDAETFSFDLLMPTRTPSSHLVKLSLPNILDFHFSKQGKHTEFTRNYLKHRNKICNYKSRDNLWLLWQYFSWLGSIAISVSVPRRLALCSSLGSQESDLHLKKYVLLCGGRIFAIFMLKN